MALLLFILLFLVGFISTFLVFFLNLPPLGGEKEHVFRSYLSVDIIFMVTAVFIFFRMIGYRISAPLLKTLNLFSQASFGIYLVHSIIMRWLNDGWQAMGFSLSIGSSLWTVPVIAVVGFLVSFVVTMVLRRIPYVKYIVP